MFLKGLAELLFRHDVRGSGRYRPLFNPKKPKHVWVMLIAFALESSEGDTRRGGQVTVRLDDVVAARGPVCYHCGLMEADAPAICIGVGGELKGT